MDDAAIKAELDRHMKAALCDLYDEDGERVFTDQEAIDLVNDLLDTIIEHADPKVTAHLLLIRAA